MGGRPVFGWDEQEFPRDFASFVRYHTELKKYIGARRPEPEPLSIQELDALAADLDRAAPVRWERHAA